MSTTRTSPPAPPASQRLGLRAMLTTLIVAAFVAAAIPGGVGLQAAEAKTGTNDGRSSF